MKKLDANLVSAIVGVLTVGVTGAAAAEHPGPQAEMCFNYRLENSCGAHPNGCGGTALGRIGCGARPERYQSPGRWMMVPAGTCERIHGGSLKPPDSQGN